jgi:hypothetical protein
MPRPDDRQTVTLAFQLPTRLAANEIGPRPLLVRNPGVRRKAERQ